MTLSKISLLLVFPIHVFAVSQSTIKQERQNAWKYTQAECRLFCEKKKVPSREDIMGVMALPRHQEPKIETNLNCFYPELICANAYNYCDGKKVAHVYLIEDKKTYKKKKINARCEISSNAGLVLRASLPQQLFTGEGLFWIDKLNYSGPKFYSKDRHYYKAVSGE